MTKLSWDILMDWAVYGIIGWLLIKLADIINKVHILVELLLANQKLFSILCVNHTSSMDLCLNVQLSEVCQDLSSAASFTPFTPHPTHPGMDKTSAVGINHSTELSDWQIYTLLQNYWDLMLGFLFGYRKKIHILTVLILKIFISSFKITYITDHKAVHAMSVCDTSVDWAQFHLESFSLMSKAYWGKFH